MTGFEGSVSHSGGGPLWHTNHRKIRSCATPPLIPEENEQQFSAETGKEQKKNSPFSGEF